MYKTFEDFKDFYEHPFIKSIAHLEKWTVSDNTKRPIDMKALIYENKIYGARLDESSNPLVDLDTLCKHLPTATNNAFYLDALADNFIVLDIEPKCPDDIKEKLLHTNYIYGEVSLSGNGYHLIYQLPTSIYNYPIAMKKITLKEEKGHYEILLNHWVTFTRNMIKPADSNADSILDIFNEMAAQQKEVHKENVTIDSIEPCDIIDGEYITDILMMQKYKKTPEDFYNDMSKYEYGCVGFYHYKLKCLLNVSRIMNNKHVYTDNEKAWLLYNIVKNKLEHRTKHDELRDGLPWLLYLAQEIIAKSTDKSKKEDS